MSRFFFSFPSNETALSASEGVFGAVIDRQKISPAEKHRLRVIVSELFNNAYLHGNKSDPSKYIDVTLDFTDGEFSVSVRDQGTGITGEALQSADLPCFNPDSEHGRGLKILRNFGDKIDMGTDPDGRFCVKVTRKIGAAMSDVAAVKG